MIVAIHAFENQYEGLHGIESFCIVEVDNISQVEELAAEESRSIIESYESFLDDFVEQAESEGLEENTDEYSQYIEECIQENIAYRIWEVIKPYGSLKQMEEDFYNDQYDFVTKYCKEIE